MDANSCSVTSVKLGELDALIWNFGLFSTDGGMRFLIGLLLLFPWMLTCFESTASDLDSRPGPTIMPSVNAATMSARITSVL